MTRTAVHREDEAGRIRDAGNEANRTSNAGHRPERGTAAARGGFAGIGSIPSRPILPSGRRMVAPARPRSTAKR